jgi:UDP-2,3-diacylglucosamine pyrophosphatase LpxH
MTQAFVISDLHLGEDNSVLTYKKAEDKNCSVDKLIEKIKEVSNLSGDGRVPELVLLGDIFDLSLAPFEDALDSVQKFINQICEADLFDAITYVPGNHDHHIWIQIVEHENFIKNIEAGRKPTPPYPRVTPLSGETWRNTFLDGLLPPCALNVTLQVAYPNRILKLAGTRIIMHHGHFCQRIWRLLSDVFESILPTTTINDLEIFNSPLTELGWYGLGQAGRVSDLMEKIYENAKAGKFDGVYEVIDALMDGIDRWDGRVDDGWLTDTRDWLSKRAIRKVANSLLEKYVRRKQAGATGASEARGKTIAADEELREGVSRYLTKYVKIQDGEKFVFGHTHRHESAQSFSIDRCVIQIANTGGWVVEPGGRKPDTYLIEITDQAEFKSHRVEIS